MTTRTIQDLKDQIKHFKCVTPWDAVEPNTTYHVPPIITLERRDIMILDKDNDKATYRRIGDKTQTERTMFKTSVFAKFIVKKKRF